mmetsp:Transcript_17895/g.29649  ORF Transcript_17895/g.29649 Transcript_17895/m.29649 type:complete len:203 (+) Transcript_17895:526-1134(+)
MITRKRKKKGRRARRRKRRKKEMRMRRKTAATAKGSPKAKEPKEANGRVLRRTPKRAAVRAVKAKRPPQLQRVEHRSKRPKGKERVSTRATTQRRANLRRGEQPISGSPMASIQGSRYLRVQPGLQAILISLLTTVEGMTFACALPALKTHTVSKAAWAIRTSIPPTIIKRPSRPLPAVPSPHSIPSLAILPWPRWSMHSPP